MHALRFLHIICCWDTFFGPSDMVFFGFPWNNYLLIKLLYMRCHCETYLASSKLWWKIHETWSLVFAEFSFFSILLSLTRFYFQSVLDTIVWFTILLYCHPLLTQFWTLIIWLVNLMSWYWLLDVLVDDLVTFTFKYYFFHM